MIQGLKVHHIGFATDNIEATSAFYLNNGYKAGDIIFDEIQRTNICFLTKEGEPALELIQPANEKSSVNKILNKNGVCPYHICYEVDDIDQAFDAMCEEGFTPLFRPVEAVAIEDRLICYFWKKEVGFVELVNK